MSILLVWGYVGDLLFRFKFFFLVLLISGLFVGWRGFVLGE